mmetsp:Transcript_58137/g.169985  ORF Transcript_58137/g.169985 Transcript_58137/m.169985 type:complete len:213 (-) Transcript_58137:53-691(-)
MLLQSQQEARWCIAHVVLKLLLPGDAQRRPAAAARGVARARRRAVQSVRPGACWWSKERKPALAGQGGVVPHGSCPPPPLLLPRLARRAGAAPALLVRDEVRVRLGTVRNYVPSCIALGPSLDQYRNAPSHSILAEWPLDEGSKLTLTGRRARGVHALRPLVGISPHVMSIGNGVPALAHREAGAEVRHTTEAEDVEPRGVQHLGDEEVHCQ